MQAWGQELVLVSEQVLEQVLAPEWVQALEVGPKVLVLAPALERELVQALALESEQVLALESVQALALESATLEWVPAWVLSWVLE